MEGPALESASTISWRVADPSARVAWSLAMRKGFALARLGLGGGLVLMLLVPLLGEGTIWLVTDAADVYASATSTLPAVVEV